MPKRCIDLKYGFSRNFDLNNYWKQPELTDEQFLDELVERRFLADNSPAFRSSFTPRESLMGYRIGEEVLEDYGLDRETHPSEFIRCDEISEEDILAVYRDSPEDAFNRMIDYCLLRTKPPEDVEPPADDVELNVARFRHLPEVQDSESAPPAPLEKPEPVDEKVGELPKAIGSRKAVILAFKPIEEGLPREAVRSSGYDRRNSRDRSRRKRRLCA